MEEIFIGATYRHYKGNLYKVLNIAKHSETMEELVIYQDLSDLSKIWARPTSMWNEMVDKEKNIKRFERVNNG